jgi:GTP cyclohydrolase I
MNTSLERDVMTTEVVTVEPSTPFKEIVARWPASSPTCCRSAATSTSACGIWACWPRRPWGGSPPPSNPPATPRRPLGASWRAALPPSRRRSPAATVAHCNRKGSDVSAVAHPLPHEPAPPGSRPRLQIVDRSPAVDLGRAEQAVADLLAALGQDPSSSHLLDTPRRVAASYAELLTPVAFTPTSFPNDEGYDELVLAKAIPFSSLCQHHLLPFVGVAHVGYLPAGRILGLSKLARVVELYSRRLQLQERLTKQVADWLQAELAPQGVGVVLEAEHLCMSLRGVRAAGARTVTSTLHGLLRTDPRSRQEFFALTGAAT